MPNGALPEFYVAPWQLSYHEDDSLKGARLNIPRPDPGSCISVGIAPMIFFDRIVDRAALSSLASWIASLHACLR